MPFVHYWPVGFTKDIPLSMTPAQICQALLADWLPSLPFSASRSVMGWPFYLIKRRSRAKIPYLYLDPISGWSDRQWKGVLSWMLGVAGTRRVLAEEKYIWIAPLSAFYSDRKREVTTLSWHPDYPPSALEISSNPGVKSNLRPDYIAARYGSDGAIEFAIVESKGTSKAMNNLTSCPSAWAEQARNAIVKLNKSEITIPRHLVVATRCNPNAVRQKTRRLKVRAWNSNTEKESYDEKILIEILTAHYSGLCLNLGLLDNMRALQLSASNRLKGSNDLDQLDQAFEKADSELNLKGGWDPSKNKNAEFEIALDRGIVHVQLANASIALIRYLRSMEDLRHGIDFHIERLSGWYSEISNTVDESANIAVDRSGFIVDAGELNFSQIQ